MTITKTAQDQFLDWLEERLGEDEGAIAEAYLDDVREEIRKDTIEEIGHSGRDEIVSELLWAKAELQKSREIVRRAVDGRLAAEHHNLKMGY